MQFQEGNSFFYQENIFNKRYWFMALRKKYFVTPIQAQPGSIMLKFIIVEFITAA